MSDNLPAKIADPVASKLVIRLEKLIVTKFSSDPVVHEAAQAFLASLKHFIAVLIARKKTK